jgi:hypothetical protein
MTQQEKGWDTSYEWKIILLLSVTFGLVGLDRPGIWALLRRMAGRWPATSAWPGVFPLS